MSGATPRDESDGGGRQDEPTGAPEAPIGGESTGRSPPPPDRTQCEQLSTPRGRNLAVRLI
eukprot:9984774-Alexandrium_andersonii.AAC.1